MSEPRVEVVGMDAVAIDFDFPAPSEIGHTGHRSRNRGGGDALRASEGGGSGDGGRAMHAAEAGEPAWVELGAEPIIGWAIRIPGHEPRIFLCRECAPEVHKGAWRTLHAGDEAAGAICVRCDSPLRSEGGDEGAAQLRGAVIERSDLPRRYFARGGRVGASGLPALIERGMVLGHRSGALQHLGPPLGRAGAIRDLAALGLRAAI